MLQNQSLRAVPAVFFQKRGQAGGGRDPTPGALPQLSGFLSSPPGTAQHLWPLSHPLAPTSTSEELSEPQDLGWEDSHAMLSCILGGCPSTPGVLTQPGREVLCAHSIDEHIKAQADDLVQAHQSPSQTPLQASPLPILHMGELSLPEGGE